MAERAREEAQHERAEARGRRRSLLAQPFEALDGAARGDGNGDALGAAKRAARTAAAAAVVGGVVGAAKALVQRHGRGDEDGEDDADRGGDEQHEQFDHEVEPRMSDDDAEVQDDATDEPAADEEEDEEPEQETREHPVAEQEQASGRGRDRAPQKGASSSEVADVIDRARAQVADLFGKEVESVSGISRQNRSWSVTVEVVEVHRIPDSTDVLSSYEVVLDDDRNLVSVDRRGRYRRSQVEEER